MINLKKPKIALIIGSAPDATRSREWDKEIFNDIVVVNNAWQIRNDWDFHIHPEDFPDDKRPKHINANQKIITADTYVKIQNSFGGFVYAGGTMCFTAAYWVLGALKPDMICFIGCDMIYPSNGLNTHFYGIGTPDPLRVDVTLQSLEAKSLRLYYLALQNNCICVNLSIQNESRLTFPRIEIDTLKDITDLDFNKRLITLKSKVDLESVQGIVKQESDLGYYFESGRYWEHLNSICSNELKAIDNAWLTSLETDQLTFN